MKIYGRQNAYSVSGTAGVFAYAVGEPTGMGSSQRIAAWVVGQDALRKQYGPMPKYSKVMPKDMFWHK